MHVRFSMCLGRAITDDEGLEPLGVLTGIFPHPDTGKIEGFFVHPPGFFRGQAFFLSSQDILRFGLRIVVRSPDVLSPLDDLVRLQPLLEDPRPMIGQRITTESGKNLGTCRDVQFDTQHFMLEWLFPKKWGRWGIGIPMSQILEVRKDMIVVRDSVAPEKGTLLPSVPIIETMPEAA